MAQGIALAVCREHTHKRELIGEKPRAEGWI